MYSLFLSFIFFYRMTIIIRIIIVIVLIINPKTLLLPLLQVI